MVFNETGVKGKGKVGVWISGGSLADHASLTRRPARSAPLRHHCCLSHHQL
jgi:hypothetical protein